MGLRTTVRGGLVMGLKALRELLAGVADEVEAAPAEAAVDAVAPAVEPVVAAVEAAPVAEGPSPEEVERLKEAAVEMLHTVFDPEIPVDIYELGLIYAIDVRPGPVVDVQMTLTSPNCPSAQSLPDEVKQKIEAIDGVVEATVEVVWEPTWTPERMSEEARLELNL